MTGYADIETILDRYTHAQEERIRAAGELLTGNLNRVIPDVNPDTMKSPQSLENIGFAGKFFLRFLKFFLTKCTEK